MGVPAAVFWPGPPAAAAAAAVPGAVANIDLTAPPALLAAAAADAEVKTEPVQKKARK